MAERDWIGVGIIAVVLVLLICYTATGHQTPPAQPQLLVITPQSLSQFTQAFNRYPSAERVVLLLSPTCPVCLEGSSAVNRILAGRPGDDVRVFAVWQPMLPTDWSRPHTRVLARLSDPRVIQVWDKDHLLAGLMEKGLPDFIQHVAAAKAFGGTLLLLILRHRNGLPQPRCRIFSAAPLSVPRQSWKPI